MENQPVPNTGMSYSGWRDALEGLACRFSRPLGLTGNKQSDCPRNRAHLPEALQKNRELHLRYVRNVRSKQPTPHLPAANGLNWQLEPLQPPPPQRHFQ